MDGRGSFIVFEGLDGSGKSTHIRALCRELLLQGWEVLRTSEPSRGRIGKFIRAYVEHRERRLPPEIEVLLYAADRFDHLKRVIEPALERGEIVVSDRYVHSSLAYQGAGGLSIEWIRELNKFALKPDLIILLDVPPETGLGRMRRRRRTVFEVYPIQKKVRNIYMQLVQKGELMSIDANRPFREVQADVYESVMNLLEGKQPPSGKR